MKVLKVIQDELYILLEYTMRYYHLLDSDLLRDSRIDLNNNIFLLVFPDYVQYVNSGRRPNAKMPPSDAIIAWCREKGIPTDNGTVYKIRQGIAREGIKPRPVIDMIFELANNDWDREWAEEVFNEIVSDLVEWFK